MPWNPEHKQATRERIVSAAAAAFREKGFAGVGVAEVMAKAGLTHGGFYAHFGSKDELIAAALELALEQSPMRQRYDSPDGGGAEDSLLQVAERYLTPRHARHPEGGCPLAALGEEWSREKGPLRRRMGEVVAHRRDRMVRRAPGSDAATRRSQAAGTLAAMVGGIVLARSLAEGPEQERFLSDVRRFLADALEPEERAATRDRLPQG